MTCPLCNGKGRTIGGHVLGFEPAGLPDMNGEVICHRCGGRGNWHADVIAAPLLIIPDPIPVPKLPGNVIDPETWTPRKLTPDEAQKRYDFEILRAHSDLEEARAEMDYAIENFASAEKRLAKDLAEAKARLEGPMEDPPLPVHLQQLENTLRDQMMEQTVNGEKLWKLIGIQRDQEQNNNNMHSGLKWTYDICQCAICKIQRGE